MLVNNYYASKEKSLNALDKELKLFTVEDLLKGRT